MPDTLTKLAYQTFQQGKSYFGLTHKTVSTQLMKLVNPPQEVKTQELGRLNFDAVAKADE